MIDTSKMRIGKMLDKLEEAIDLGEYYEGDLFVHLCHEDRDERQDEIDEDDRVFIDAHEIIRELRKRLK